MSTQTTQGIGYDLDTIDGRFEARYERGALAIRWPDWTQAHALRFALLTYAVDGHDGAIGYAHDTELLCPPCADRIPSGTPGLTVAQDSALAGMDYTREHSSAVLDGAEWQELPSCGNCGAPIVGITLLDIDTERRAYIAVHVRIERGKRAGCEPSAPMEDMQTARAEVLARHGVNMDALDRAARIADRRSRVSERAEGWR